MRRWAAAARAARAEAKGRCAIERRAPDRSDARLVFHVGSPTVISSVRQRVRTNLEVHGERLAPLAAFAQPRGAVAAGAPQSAALPAGIGIVDAAVESLRVPPHRIRHAQR